MDRNLITATVDELNQYLLGNVTKEGAIDALSTLLNVLNNE
jgi:hypothetical protein